MGKKTDYLIWREQNGSFSALDRKFRMTTWSTVNGKIIKSISNDEENEHLENQYELYKANKIDKSYTNNFTQMNKFSYSLVIAKQPCKDDPLPMIRQKT